MPFIFAKLPLLKPTLLPPQKATAPCFHLHNVTSTARTSSTSRSRIADLLSPTALYQSKAEGQGVGVAAGGPGRAHCYADPVLKASKHRIGIRRFQDHSVLRSVRVCLVPFLGQHVEQQLTAGVVQQAVALGCIIIVFPCVDGHLQLLLLGNGRA